LTKKCGIGSIVPRKKGDVRTIRLLLAVCFALIASWQLWAQDDSCDVPLVVTRFVATTRKVELVTDLASEDLSVRVGGTPSTVRSASVDSGGKRVALILDASKNIPSDEWKLETEMATALVENGRAPDRFSLYLVGIDASFSPFLTAGGLQARLRDLESSRPQPVDGNERIYDALLAASKAFDSPEFGDSIFFLGHADDGGSLTTLGKIQGMILRNRLRLYAMSFGKFSPRSDPSSPLPMEDATRATGYFFSYHSVENLKFPGQTALLKGFIADLYAGIANPYRVKIVQTAPGRSSLELTVVNGESRNIRQDDVHYPHFVYPCTGSTGENAPDEEELPTRPAVRRARISWGVLDHIVVHRVLPQPPWSNEPGHEQGVVTIGVMLDYDGTLKTTSVVSGDPVLAEVATNAIKRWQFKPFVLGGQPLQVESQVAMKFSKKRAEVVVGEH
jgi:hypothetical protein